MSEHSNCCKESEYAVFFSSYCLAEGGNTGGRDRAICTVTLLISAQPPSSASKPKALCTSSHRLQPVFNFLLWKITNIYRDKIDIALLWFSLTSDP